MNYVERHFGDWARDTAHLSMLEDGAYNRLCDLYYVREEPLPADLAACCRLVRANSPAERKAVEAVLGEFFEHGPSGWRHKRCDAEIERYRDRTAGNEAKTQNERERQQRHREERKRLFECLREIGVTPAYDATTAELRRMSRVTGRHVTATVTCDATATQTPNTKHQTPNTSPHTPAGALAKAMREKGVQGSPHEPRLIAFAEAGVTPAMLSSACDTALAAKPNERIPAGYVYGIVDRWLREPATAPPKSSADVAAEALRLLEERDAQSRPAETH